MTGFEWVNHDLWTFFAYWSAYILENKHIFLTYVMFIFILYNLFQY